MSLIDVVALLCCLAGGVCANLRWWRVAQREHYLAGSVSRFDWRWASSRVINQVSRVGALIAVAFSALNWIGAVVTGLMAIVAPVGLGIKGRTSKLVWTKRMKSVAVVTVLVQVLIVAIGFAVGHVVTAAAAAVFFSSLLVDIALSILAPYERNKAKTFVESARKRLQAVAPTVVAITGSYGKTSTKQYAAHLVSSSKTVFASPASFNNRAGLSKAVNEQLTPGTDVFIAEMGTYGRGEIAELCDIFPPEIAVMTAIGPVHLERFGSEDVIVEAKSEIFDKASVCVLNVDDPRIAALVEGLTEAGKTVWCCGSAEDADVRVGDSAVMIKGRKVFSGTLPNAPVTNVACAVAIASQLGVSDEAIGEGLPTLPVPQHRQEVAVTPEGLTVVDDTFNANPASVQRALEVLAQQAPMGRRIVVTPGIVELGPRQFEENRAFGLAATKVANDVIVVGRTNRASLSEGVRDGGMTPIVVDRLDEAVAWVRQHIGSGDAVAYINDLPDHFP